jgi:hypothetical protein
VVWGRLVVWGAKIKGENDAAASWAQRLVKEKEPLGTDDTKVRLMMDFLGTSTKRSSTNSQNTHHKQLPQQQTQQQPGSTQVSNLTQQRRFFRYGGTEDGDVLSRVRPICEGGGAGEIRVSGVVERQEEVKSKLFKKADPPSSIRYQGSREPHQWYDLSCLKTRFIRRFKALHSFCLLDCQIK